MSFTTWMPSSRRDASRNPGTAWSWPEAGRASIPLGRKTLIFCASDEHADLVVRLLKALARRYGSVDDDAVAKITGQVDRPLQTVRRYRNERQPNITVTVDLLTAGVDVPNCQPGVSAARKSRILYEQMLGRATRLCPEIGKSASRIFDAVSLFAGSR